MTSNLKRLYVTRFPLGTTAQQLGKLFEDIGPIFECRIPFQKQYAFVEYLEPEDAQTAMTKMNEITVGEEKLVVSWATPRHQQSYVQKEGAFNSCNQVRRVQRFFMPTDELEDPSKGNSSFSSKTATSQQSPKESSCGWDDDVQADGITDTATQGALDLGEVEEVQTKPDRGWGSEPQQRFSNFRPVTIQNNRSEGDLHMLDDVEKRTMKQSGSEPCLSKRKRSFDATGESASTEKNKRVHEEQGW